MFETSRLLQPVDPVAPACESMFVTLGISASSTFEGHETIDTWATLAKFIVVVFVIGMVANCGMQKGFHLLRSITL